MYCEVVVLDDIETNAGNTHEQSAKVLQGACCGCFDCKQEHINGRAPHES